MSLLKGKLVNVSNRLPVQLKKSAGGMRMTPSSGGLASALDSVWRKQKGTWIGWAGGDAEQSDELLAKASKKRSYTLRGVTLSKDEVAKFYSGFANEIIWPLFHDFPARCNFDPDYWEVYQSVNLKFAGAAAEAAKEPGDFVWVHDYHLMLMAQYLKQLGSGAKTAFFLHIPFPAPGMFEKLPWRETILRGLLHFNLLGFQSTRDRDNFVDCIRRFVPAAEINSGAPETNDEVSLEDHVTAVGAFPISIDFEEFANRAASASIAASAAALRKELNDNILVLGVDRMDYTKGIPERLKAFRIFLRRFPQFRHKVTLIQVVVPSREDIQNYKDLRREVELLITQINGEFTEPGWVPIHYLHRNLKRDELLTYYRAADIALVTSLKDGMNLVAKEFCAAQIDERGTVIISEFAGAAPELNGAIVVNPNDFLGVAAALHEACVMPPEEKRERMKNLRSTVKENNVARWAGSFLESAARYGETV